MLVDALHARHGLSILLAALDRLADHDAPWVGTLELLIIGRAGSHGAEPAGVLFNQHRTNWPFRVRIADPAVMESRKTLRMLGPRDIAIVPARAVGSLWDGLATEAGLSRVVVAPADVTATTGVNTDTMLRLTPVDIASALIAFFEDDLSGGAHTSAASQATVSPTLEGLAQPRARSPRAARAPRTPATPLVSLCVSHFNRPALLWQTLKSIAANDYSEREIIVVDDGSTLPGIEHELDHIAAWLSTHNGRLIRQSNRYLGAARNTAWRAAKGSAIIFMDDDNLACPDMIRRFVDAQARTGADVLTSLFYCFEGNALVDPGATPPQVLTAPSGPDPLLGSLFNCFGDANMMITREALDRVGGFTEDYGRGFEDWELFTRCALAGLKLERVMQPLFWYRLSTDSMLRRRPDDTADRLRSLRAYRGASHGDVYRLALALNGEIKARLHASLASGNT